MRVSSSLVFAGLSTHGRPKAPRATQNESRGNPLGTNIGKLGVQNLVDVYV